MKRSLMLPAFMLCCLVFCACKKSSNSTVNDNNSNNGYTAKMGGIRNWHVMEHYQVHRYISPDSAQYSDTTYYSDQVFALTIVDGKTVELSGNAYAYAKTDSTNGTFLFSGTTSPGLVTYYYKNDSIVYTFHDDGVSFSNDVQYCTY